MIFFQQQAFFCTEHFYSYKMFCQERKAMNPLRPYEHLDNLKQFLEYDRKVLRFDAYWDDSESMFGDRRHLVCLLWILETCFYELVSCFNT